MKKSPQKQETTKIFGYEWEQIKDAQQGISNALRPLIRQQETPEAMKQKIESEIVKFGLHVHKDVALAFNVAIPANYVLDGDTYKPQ